MCMYMYNLDYNFLTYNCHKGDLPREKQIRNTDTDSISEVSAHQNLPGDVGQKNN